MPGTGFEETNHVPAPACPVFDAASPSQTPPAGTGAVGRDDGHARRPDYTPTALPETFIVPLLRRLIAEGLSSHAAPLASAGASTTNGRLDPRPQALDVGCGRQPFRDRLEALGYRYTGQDVQQNPEQTVDVVCPIDQPAPADLRGRGPFQFILCTEVLEHVADWSQTFANFRDLLAPGGRLLITCPHVYPLHEQPYDYWRPTPYALAYFAGRYGLKVVEQRSAGSGWDVLGTTLGSCLIKARGPGLWHRATRAGLAVLRRGAVWIIRSGLPQRLADLGGMYLSNYIVLERA